MRDLESAAPVAPDTLWRIFSMTKPITAAAAIILWQEGRFQLDDPIEVWLPELAEPKVLDRRVTDSLTTVPREAFGLMELDLRRPVPTSGFAHV